MLEKKNNRDLCPFRGLKKCSDKCSLFRKGTRTSDVTGETFIVESCAINVIADNMEMTHNRAFMLQKEVGETKNVVAFKVMTDLGLSSEQEARRQVEKVLIPIVEKIQKKKLPEK